MPEFAGFHAGLCRPFLTQMSEFAQGKQHETIKSRRAFCRATPLHQIDQPLEAMSFSAHPSKRCPRLDYKGL
jgi:hypothetical protein